VLFVCIVLFAVIWWNVCHSRTNWLPMFIVLILLAVMTAFYAARGFVKSVRKTMQRHN
jgi:glucan phosphoethanolaminetransferase (alkaline phosphatase superfamily)